MGSYPAQVALIEESHREHDSLYVFEDRILAARASTDYAWSVRLGEPIHRISYSDDQRPTITIERECGAFEDIAEVLGGSVMIKLSLRRGWAMGGVWRTEQHTIILFDLENDAEAFAKARHCRYHRASVSERWLGGAA
jgi:hypothetical protein